MGPDLAKRLGGPAKEEVEGAGGKKKENQPWVPRQTLKQREIFLCKHASWFQLGSAFSA